VAAAIGVNLILNPLNIAAVVAIVMISGICFSSQSISISTFLKSKSRERVFGLAQLLTMPLFFARNALYPISFMPSWLKVISALNPLSYTVNALRILMIIGNFDRF
jgi:ABC-2 type transport system permease protein